jgi:hypothetical protein
MTLLPNSASIWSSVTRTAGRLDTSTNSSAHQTACQAPGLPAHSAPGDDAPPDLPTPRTRAQAPPPPSAHQRAEWSRPASPQHIQPDPLNAKPLVRPHTACHGARDGTTIQRHNGAGVALPTTPLAPTDARTVGLTSSTGHPQIPRAVNAV